MSSITTQGIYSAASGPAAVAIEFEKGGNPRVAAATFDAASGALKVRDDCAAGGCWHGERLQEIAKRIWQVRRVEFGPSPTPEEVERLVLDRDLTPEENGQTGYFTLLEIGRVASAASGDWRGYLESQDVPKELITHVGEFRSRYGESPNVRPPRTAFHGPKAVLTVVGSLLAGQGVLFKGPKSTGKTLLAEQMAWVFGRELAESAGSAETQRGDLLGERTLGLEDGQPVVKYDLGILARAMEEGAFLLADEFNMVRPEIAALFNPVLDGRGRITIVGYGTVQASPAFRVLATMNYGYAGTSETNEATADRLVSVRLEEAPVASILQRETGVSRDVAERLGVLFETLQHLLLDGDILDTRAVSLRGLIQVCRLVGAGVPLGSAVKAGVVDKVDDDEARAKVADAAKMHGLLEDGELR